MKKCLIFIITLMLALLPCAQAMAAGEAQRHTSSLGYSVELSEYWFQLSPDTVGAFAQLLEVTEAEVPELMGFSSDYITNFDGRTRDAYYNIGGNSAGGNVIIRRLPESESDGFGTLEGHRSAMEQELIPMMESIGATVLLMPEITTIGARDFVVNGFNLMDTNAYQYTTISAAGPWYELTFTEVTEGDALSILESIAFEGEDAPAATPEPAANQDAEYSLAIAGEFDEANPPYAGAWREFEEAGLRIYLPDSVSAIDAEDWLLFSGKMQDGTTLHINASTVFAEGLSIEDTFSDFKAMYYGMDADVYMISIGDIPVIIADDRETGICTYYVFNCDPDFNRWFSINFDYETAADFAAYNLILSSLQHVETQAAPEPTAGTSSLFGKNPKKPLNKDAKIVASQEEGLRFASDEFKAMLNLALGKEAGAPVYAEELAGIEEVYITGGRLYFDEAAFNEISGDEPLVWMPVDDVSHFANLHKLGIANVGVESTSGLEELGLLELAFVYCEFAEGLVLPEMFIEEEFGVMYCGLEDLSLIQNVSSVQLLLAKNSLRSLQGLNVKPEVEYLVLSDNQLTNLAGIEAFPNVSLLYADNNQLDSLAGISALSGLTYLNVQNNKITSLEPLAGSAKLGRLLAAGNMISSLDSLAGLTSLTSLDIQDNLVSSLEPLRGLPITYLYASGNQISSLEPLAEGSNLKTLYLSGNRISSIDALTGHVQLRNLDMSNNSISSIEALSGLTYLRNVDVSGNSISSLEPLSGKEYLVVLNASGNKISSLEPLAGMKNLDYLLVAHNRISSLEPLYEYGVGKALDVSYNQFTSIEWMRETRSALMDVSGNPLTSLAPLDYISSGIYLYVADLANVSDWSYTERLKYVYHYTMQEHMQETDGQSIDPFRNIRVENWY